MLMQKQLTSPPLKLIDLNGRTYLIMVDKVEPRDNMDEKF